MKVNSLKKTIVVKSKDLNLTHKHQLLTGTLKPIEINYNMVHGNRRYEINKFIDKGYNVVFNHEEKNYLLIFNR